MCLRHDQCAFSRGKCIRDKRSGEHLNFLLGRLASSVREFVTGHIIAQLAKYTYSTSTRYVRPTSRFTSIAFLSTQLHEPRRNDPPRPEDSSLCHLHLPRSQLPFHILTAPYLGTTYTARAISRPTKPVLPPNQFLREKRYVHRCSRY